MMLREQTLRVGMDKARSSKRQLEQRARKLINRIRGQHEFDPENISPTWYRKPIGGNNWYCSKPS